MAVRVHVLRTCDRCGRPIETDGAVPIQQLKEGDTVPVFHRSVLRVTREEPSMDGGEPTVKVLGTFRDICDTCTHVVERALDTLLKRPSDEEDASATTGSEPVAEPKRKRAGRAPKSVAPDMPGPHGAAPPAATPATQDTSSGGTSDGAVPTAPIADAATSETASGASDETAGEPF